MVDITYQASVEPEELPGRPYPRLPDQVSPQAYGAGFGKDIEQAGGIVQQVHDSAMEQVRKTQALDLENKVMAFNSTTLHDPQNGLMQLQGQNAFGAAQKYTAQFSQFAQQQLAGITDSRMKLVAQQILQQHQYNGLSQIDNHEAQAYAKMNEDTAKANIQLHAQGMGANANDPSIVASHYQSLTDAANHYADLAGMSDSVRQEFVYQQQMQGHVATIQSLLDNNRPTEAAHYLDAYRGEIKPTELKQLQNAIQEGRVKSVVSGVMGAYSQGTELGEQALEKVSQSGLDSEGQAKAYSEIERQRNAMTYQKAQQYDKPLTALYSSIAAGNVPANAVSQANWLYAQGALRQDQHISLLDSIARAEKKGEKDDEKVAFATSAYQNGWKIDPKDSASVGPMNQLFQRMTSSMAPGSPQYVQAAETMAARNGIVPKDAVSWARANILSGEPQTASTAAQMLDRLERINPSAYGVEVEDKQLRASAHTINTAVAAGTDPLVAVAMARENAAKTETQLKFLDSQWNSQFPKGIHEVVEAKAIRDGLKSDPLYSGPGLIFKAEVPTVPNAMAAEYNDLTREYFNHTNGNLQQARALALNDLKGTWGVSQVNGQRELMKYAPERMFPGLTSTAIRSDIDAVAPGGHLVESTETAASRGMIWNIATKDEFGAYDVKRDKDGLPLRYQLPGNEELEKQKQALEAKDRQSVEAEQQTQSMQHAGLAAAGHIGF